MNTDTKELIDKLEAAKIRRDQAHQDLLNAEREVDAAQKEIIWHAHGIRIGSTVNHEGAVWRVTKMRAAWRPDARPSVDGSKQKKDGTFSDRSQFIGSIYEIKTP